MDKNPLNKKIQAMTTDPGLRSIISKLVEPLEPTNGSKQNVSSPDEMVLRSISNTTTANIMDSKAIFSMLPDVELAFQILKSTILSPKDMVTVDLQYSFLEGTMDGDQAGQLLKVISSYWEGTYKINEKLDPMLDDILAHKGSYPIIILPESSIDYLINGNTTISTESLAGVVTTEGDLRPLGLLGDPTIKAGDSNSLKLALESIQKIDTTSPSANTAISFQDKDNKIISTEVFVTDNFSAIRVPELLKKISEVRVKNVFGRNKIKASMEARGDKNTPIDNSHFESALYAKRSFKHIPAAVIPTGSQLGSRGTGHPLMQHLPPEAVIPVHVPSSPTDHIGYFLLLDINGNPINNSTRTDYYNDISSNLNVRQETVQALMSTSTQRANSIFGDNVGRAEIDNMAKTYGRIIEADLLARLKNGVYGNNVSISAPDEFYRVMLARTLAKQKTQLLYIPAELMVYMAFDYNEYGVGVSMIDKTKVISSMRAMLMFANTLAAVKNATGRTNVNIELDENDPYPAKTVEELVDSYTTVNSARFPISVSSAKDIVDYLQKAGIGIHVSGNSRYPNTNLTVEDRNTNRVMIDSELSDNLRKNQIMGFGLSPESVDLGLNVEFAQSIVNSNLLLAKRASVWQRLFCGFITQMITKFGLNSEQMISDLLAVIEEQKIIPPQIVTDIFNKNPKEYKDNVNNCFIEYLFERLTVSLPSPDTASLETQFNALEIYEKSLDKMLESFASSSLMNEESSGMIAGQIDLYIANLKSYFMRAWAVQNNFMPELTELSARDSDGKATFDLVEKQGEYLSGIGDVFTKFVEYMDKEKKQREEKLSKAGIGDPVDLDEPLTDPEDLEEGNVEDELPSDDLQLEEDEAPNDQPEEENTDVLENEEEELPPESLEDEIEEK